MKSVHVAAPLLRREHGGLSATSTCDRVLMMDGSFHIKQITPML